MDNKAIHQALKELEKGLSNLDSARNQVENITDASRQLLPPFQAILNSLQHIEHDLNSQKGSIAQLLKAASDNITQRISNAEKKHLQVITDASSRITNELTTVNELIAQHQNNIKSNINSFEQSVENELTKIENLTTENINHIKSSLVATLSKIEDVIQSNITQLDTNINERNTALTQDFSILNSKINESRTLIEAFNLQVQQFNQSTTLQQVIDNLNKAQKELSDTNTAFVNTIAQAKLDYSLQLAEQQNTIISTLKSDLIESQNTTVTTLENKIHDAQKLTVETLNQQITDAYKSIKTLSIISITSLIASVILIIILLIK